MKLVGYPIFKSMRCLGLINDGYYNDEEVDKIIEESRKGEATDKIDGFPRTSGTDSMAKPVDKIKVYPQEVEMVDIDEVRIHMLRDGYIVCGEEDLPKTYHTSDWDWVDCLECIQSMPIDGHCECDNNEEDWDENVDVFNAQGIKDVSELT